MWDRPFQWGSKRTGPDLARQGGKNPNAWHYDHMAKPQQVKAGSIMPPYPWLLTDRADVDDIKAKLGAMQSLGVPYTDEEVSNAETDYRTQADEFVADLAVNGKEATWDREIVALIAYLQRLGKNEFADEVATGEGK